MQRHAWVPTPTNVLLFSHQSSLADVSWFSSSSLVIHKQWEIVDHLTLWSIEEMVDGDKNVDVVSLMFPLTSHKVCLASPEPASELWTPKTERHCFRLQEHCGYSNVSNNSISKSHSLLLSVPSVSFRQQWSWYFLEKCRRRLWNTISLRCYYYTHTQICMDRTQRN